MSHLQLPTGRVIRRCSPGSYRIFRQRPTLTASSPLSATALAFILCCNTREKIQVPATHHLLRQISAFHVTRVPTKWDGEEWCLRQESALGIFPSLKVRKASSGLTQGTHSWREGRVPGRAGDSRRGEARRPRTWHERPGTARLQGSKDLGLYPESLRSPGSTSSTAITQSGGWTHLPTLGLPASKRGALRDWRPLAPSCVRAR